MRMEYDRAVFRVFDTLPFGERPRGRPKKKWADHIMRMERIRAALRVFNTVPFGQRPRGRPKKR